MHLLGFEGASAETILSFLRLADGFVDSDGRLATPAEYADALKGESVGLLFFEPSTRTRASFELAVNRLGGYPLHLSSESSSIKKGETEVDTCQNLQAMGVSSFVFRHRSASVVHEVAEAVDVPVVNAGNGTGEHPTQALLDAFTLRHALGRDGDLEGIVVTIMGDIRHSRVARSNVYALTALGAMVRIAGPPELLPQEDLDWPVERYEERAPALRDADAVMVLRIQAERMPANVVDVHAFVRRWSIDADVVAQEMADHTFIMHPGPVIRGIELTDEVADSDRSLILHQTRNGVAVRQAVLIRCLGKE
jgi:aspartate carbamoyltransferase catalytic subunit